MQTLTKPKVTEACATCTNGKHVRDSDNTIKLRCVKKNENVCGYWKCGEWRVVEK